MKNEHIIKKTLEGEEWSALLDDAFKKENSKVTISGFRKGKAPKDIYIKTYGYETLYGSAVDKAIEKAYKEILDEKDLIIVHQPAVDILEIDEKHVTLEFKIITKPEVKVSSYKNLNVKKDKVSVTKKEIDDEINKLRDQYAEVVEKENGAVEDGNIAVIDFVGSVDGKEFEGGTANNYELTIGSDSFVEGFEEQIIGKKIGDIFDVNVKFPEDYHEELKGKDAVFKVTLNGIKERVLPEINADFFMDLGFDADTTEEEFRDQIKEDLMQNKEKNAENKYTEDLIEAGIKNVEVEINEEIIDDEEERIISNRFEGLKAYGITEEQYYQMFNKTREDEKKSVRETAIKNIKARYLIDEIIEKEKLEVTEEKVQEHTKYLCDRYRCSEEELIQELGMDQIRYDKLIHDAFEILGSNEK